jgi:hypothetical protein
MLNSNYHDAYQQGLEAYPLHGYLIIIVFPSSFGNVSFFLDCQGKVCLYNGTLDLDTCECRCSAYASGIQCEKCK